MNILQIGSYLPPDTPGGAEISARNIASALVEVGHNITRMRWRKSHEKHLIGEVGQTDDRQWIGKTWRPYTPLESGNGIRKLVFYGLEMYAPLEPGGIQKIHDHDDIQAVIVHSFRGFGYNIISQLADLNVPTTFFLHDYALTCMNKGRFRNQKVCKNTCGECRLLVLKNRRSLNRIDDLAIIGPSQNIVYQTKEILQLDRANFQHIPNPNKYDVIPRSRSTPSRFVIGYVGRLEEEKGILGLLNILDNLHSSHKIEFVVAGDGSLSDVVRIFADEREWVHYRGFVPPDQMMLIYDEIDVIIVPSLWPENFSGVLVQALGNGIPAVGFDTGGVPEIIRDGLTGAVVPLGDFSALSNAVVDIMTVPGRFESMSSASLEAFNCYDSDVLRGRIINVIERTADVA